MGHEQRLRRKGIVHRRPQPPGDPDYWMKRAQHFERALLAAVASCPGMELRVMNQDLSGYQLDAQEILDNGERRGVVFKVVGDGPPKEVCVDEVKQPSGETVIMIPKVETPANIAALAFEEQISPAGFKIVDKRRSLGPTVGPDEAPELGYTGEQVNQAAIEAYDKEVKESGDPS